MNCFNRWLRFEITHRIGVKSGKIMYIRKESIGLFFPPCPQCLNRTEMPECALRDLPFLLSHCSHAVCRPLIAANTGVLCTSYNTRYFAAEQTNATPATDALSSTIQSRRVNSYRANKPASADEPCVRGKLRTGFDHPEWPFASKAVFAANTFDARNSASAKPSDLETPDAKAVLCE